MTHFGKIRTAILFVLIVLLFVFIIRSCSNDSDNPSSSSFNQNNGETMTVQEPTRVAISKDGLYDNTEPKTWTSQNGKTFSVGVKLSDSMDAIYLNIRCSAASDGNEVGYYLKSTRGLLEYSDETSVLSDCDSGNNVQHANFFIPRRYYNSVAAMEYVNNNQYGVRWSDDGSDGVTTGTTISVRAVNLKTAEFLGIFDIIIAYNDKTRHYSIDSINSADVSEYKLLSDKERAEAVQTAIDFAAEHMFPNNDWKAAAKAGAVVHKVNRAYFARFLNTEGKSDKSVNYWTCQDTFAVTFPVSYYGYGTVYLAPKTECIGLTEPKAYGSNSLDLQVYGYDPINPRNEETIIAPIDFFSQ